MAKPKTTDPARMMPASLVSPRERADALLDPSATAVAKGAVEGAWSIEPAEDDWAPDEAFLLEEGEVKHILPGTAIRVQSCDGWLHCEFPQSGGLYGPAVWAPADPASDHDLLAEAREDHTKWKIGMPIGLLVLLPTVVGMPLWLSRIQDRLIDPAVTDKAAVMAELMLFADAVPYSVFGGFGLAAAAGIGAEILRRRLHPLTIESVNQRVSAVLRMPRSALKALGGSRPHLKLVASDEPMDDLDQAIADSLVSYHAQRARLMSKKIASSPLLEHTYTMLEEISLRMEADRSALRDDGLRRTYLELIQRAEADVTLVLEKKDAATAEALVGDMTALLTQMDRHRA